MGSFGMDWNQKSPVFWDWENLPLIGMNSTENPKNVMQAGPKPAGVGAAIGHESTHSSSGTFSSSSEMGYGSSKSSISPSTDSSSKAGNNMLNFAPIKEPDRNLGKNTELCKVYDTGTSSSSVVAANPAEPVIGLKLGKRTYFEDVCGGQNAKSSPSAVSATTPPAASGKKAKVAQQNSLNSYCQVEGCRVDLSSAKSYHRKHRVCEAHSKAPKVVVAGLERRFCQQCSRFHALTEFDQKKRSCRRRLSDHNSRRRKPQPEAISFSSSRLSSMFYDGRQPTSLFFGEAPYGQMRARASSSWDNPVGFEFPETKVPWLKPARAAGVDVMHVSSQQASNNMQPHRAHAPHHGFDGLMAFKETSGKVLNQGMEAPAVASNSGTGAPDLHRALSLLSSNSVGAASLQPSSHMHSVVTTIAGTSNPLMHPVDWQGGPLLDQQTLFPAFARLSNIDGATPHELQLPKPSFDNSHYDQMH